MNSKSLEERKYRWDRSEQNSQKVQYERKRTDFSPFKKEFSNVRNTNRRDTGSLLFKDCIISRSLLRIKRSHLNSNATEDCSYLKNFKVVGSYSWALDSTPEHPILVIPGESDRMSSHKPKLEQLKKISYHFIMDENALQFPHYPIEPVYQAISQCTPDFDWKNVDIILDRMTLSNLLKFVENEPSKLYSSFSSDFRVDFQRIENSIVIFLSNEGPQKFSHDYYKDFEAKVTNKNTKSGLHSKISSYKLGHLNLLVRCEADYSDTDSERGDLSALMPGIDLNDINDLACQIEGSRLSCVKRGTLQDHQNTVLLGTKSCYGDRFEFPEVKYSLLLLSHSKNLLVGWHHKGMLKKIEKFSYDEVIKRSNKNMQTIHESMSKLTDLLGKLKDFVFSQQEENVRYSAIFIGGNDVRNQEDCCLNVYKCNGVKDVIPANLAAKIYGNKEFKKEPISSKIPSRDDIIKLANEIYG